MYVQHKTKKSGLAFLLNRLGSVLNGEMRIIVLGVL